LFPGIGRDGAAAALEISGGDFDIAVQVIKEHQQARGRQGGGKKIKKRRKSKRRKTKRRVKNKNKTKKSKKSKKR
jgi:hypothetical protein